MPPRTPHLAPLLITPARGTARPPPLAPSFVSASNSLLLPPPPTHTLRLSSSCQRRRPRSPGTVTATPTFLTPCPASSFTTRPPMTHCASMAHSYTLAMTGSDPLPPSSDQPSGSSSSSSSSSYQSIPSAKGTPSTKASLSSSALPTSTPAPVPGHKQQHAARDGQRLQVLDPASLFVFLRHMPERFRVVFLSFLSFVICNCDRINISVAILPMAKYYGWTQTTVGLVQSAFFWGYVLTQIPGGYVADKLGGKHVLSFGVITWSAMTILTPAAASTNIGVLLVARALLGFGEGVAMPAVNNLVSKWVPETERSRSLSLIYSGMYMGSVIGLSLCPTLIVAFGWQSVFYFFGGIGFFWWALWQLLATSTPQLSTTISDAERSFILAHRRDEAKPGVAQSLLKGAGPGSDTGGGSDNDMAERIPWTELLTHPASWAIITAHFCTTWGYFVLLTWLPTYFNQKLGFDLAASSFLSILPWLAMFVFANVGGAVADGLRARGLSTTTVRKTMQTVGMMGPAVFLGLVSTTQSAATAVGLMTAALALGSFTQSGVYSNHQDIGPQYAGILLGISNTAAAIPGIVGVALTGYILDQTGSWAAVFSIAIGFYTLGTVVYNLFATGERVFK